jgi:hypothetical protein
MNWNGKLSRLRELKASIEQYILESGWPAPQPGATMITPAPLREAAEITVEQDFQVGAKR